MLDRIPPELRDRNQWLLAAANEKGQLKVPSKYDSEGRIWPADPTDRNAYMSLDTAISAAQHFQTGIGFALTSDDPFVVIDLDYKDATTHPDEPKIWTTQEQIERYSLIIQHFASYTELSQSGKGVHIWIKADKRSTKQKDGVELYCKDHFIACTFNNINDNPIEDRRELFDILYSEIVAQQNINRIRLDETEQFYTDSEIWARAVNADNSGKFVALCSGHWQQFGYPSQSEADLSLMSMFTFYSQSNEQCRRLFRETVLGQRAKATKNDVYLDRTLSLVRGRQEKENAILAAQSENVRGMITNLQDQSLARMEAEIEQDDDTQIEPPVVISPPGAQSIGPAGIDWPPGMCGALARWIYSTAPRPIPEVAIVAALGWLAGVCGKAWHVPGSGLNMYVILIAKSGVGKEAMHTGLSLLTDRLKEGTPTAGNFIDFGDMASGPALAKACAKNQSFVNVSSEFGRKLRKLADDNDHGPTAALRTLMTALYQKSGPGSIVGGIKYSDKDKDVEAVSGVAFSMIGETTPKTLYECLTERMMEDGFLSRFTFIESDCPRPPLNENQIRDMPYELKAYCQELVIESCKILDNHNRRLVSPDDVAAKILKDFGIETDNRVNGTDDEARRQSWSRAHLKCLRISALLAVADDFLNPIIKPHHVNWALDLIRKDIELIQNRIENGDIGAGDAAREKKIKWVIKDYLEKGASAGYKVDARMRMQGVVSRRYLQMRVTKNINFTSHRLGATRALNETLQMMIDSGYLLEIAPDQANLMFASPGKCYKILDLEM